MTTTFTFLHVDMELTGSVSILSAPSWAEPRSLLWDHSSLCRQADARAPSFPSGGAPGASPAGYRLTDVVATSCDPSGFICSESLGYGGFALVVFLPKFGEKHRTINCASVQFSCSVVSDSLRPHESQHTRPPCPSPTPGVHPDSRPSSQ